MPKPVVAVINDAYDTIERLSRALERAGFEVVGLTSSEVRNGGVRLDALAKHRGLTAIVYDVAIPYRENWEHLRSLLENSSGLPPIVITTQSRRILERLVGGAQGIEISGDVVHTERVVAAVRRVAGQHEG